MHKCIRLCMHALAVSVLPVESRWPRRRQQSDNNNRSRRIENLPIGNCICHCVENVTFLRSTDRFDLHFIALPHKTHPRQQKVNKIDTTYASWCTILFFIIWWFSETTPRVSPAMISSIIDPVTSSPQRNQLQCEISQWQIN